MQKYNLKKDFIANVKSKIKRGFTLIELLVVISIIALLASVILSSLNTAQMKARDAQRILALQQIQKALELYYDKNGNYPMATIIPGILSDQTTEWDALGVALSPYLSPIPKDPVNNSAGLFNWNQIPNYPSNAYFYITNSSGSTYDLVTWFEYSNNPLSCSKNKWYFNTGLNSAPPGIWCPVSSFGNSVYFYINNNENLYDINGIQR